jgi:hypothetical protein
MSLTKYNLGKKNMEIERTPVEVDIDGVEGPFDNSDLGKAVQAFEHKTLRLAQASTQWTNI